MILEMDTMQIMQAVAFSSTFGGGKRVLSQRGRLLTLTSINSGRRGKIVLDQSSYLLHLITVYSLGGTLLWARAFENLCLGGLRCGFGVMIFLGGTLAQPFGDPKGWL